MRRIASFVAGLAVMAALCVPSAQAAFPGANGMLAVQPRAGGGIVLVGADGRGVRRICTDRERCGAPRRPRWSPDGRALVFAGPAIKIVAADGSCMSCQFGAAPNPAFKPGGTLISFIQRGQTTIDAIDGNRPGFQVPAAASDAVWSAGGKIALVHNGAIWAGREAFPDRIAKGTAPSWSPSGDAIAASQRGWVVVMRLRDHRVRRLVRGSAPAFSPDGRLIAYVAPDHRLMVVSASGGSAPRRVGGVRAVSVDWQPRPRGPNPGCVAPQGSRVIARSSDAVVTADGSSSGPVLAYMGCLRADGRERLLDRIVDNSGYGVLHVGSVLFALPYLGLVMDTVDGHYATWSSALEVFDMRRGVLTKLGGQSSTCSGPCAGSGLGHVVLGHDGVSAAHVQAIDPVGFLSTPIVRISCPPGSTVCVAVDQLGRMLISNDPPAGARGWAFATVADRPGVVSCPSVSLCVAVGDKIDTSTNPGGGQATWTSAPLVVSASSTNALSCPSTTLCVASRADGSVASSTEPTGGGGAWSLAAIDDHTALEGLFCSALPKCFVSDNAQRVFTSTNPAAGAGAWTRSTRTPSFHAGACPTTALCVAVTDNNILTATDPVAEDWAPTTVPDVLDSVACPSASLCLAVGWNGALEISTDPAARTWTRTTIDEGRLLDAISCPSISLCVATDLNGHVVTSTDPTGGPSAWTPALIEGDLCADTTPCSEETIQTSDGTGVHTVDTSKLPGNGPFLTNLALTGDVLSWSHAGTPKSATLARPR